MIEGAVVSGSNEVFRFSGHETFACRYAWLPKAYRAIKADPAAFVDEQAAMVDLGIGKNMVRSLRFWVEAAGLAEPQNRELRLTDFAHAISVRRGSIHILRTYELFWLLHWKLFFTAQGRPIRMAVPAELLAVSGTYALRSAQCIRRASPPS